MSKEKQPEKQKIDIRDLHSEGKETVKKAYNALRRYGYWTAIVILLIISILFATLTVGDIYKRNDIDLEDILQKYEDTGHELTRHDKIIIADIVMEAFSRSEIVTYNEYDKFLERIQTYNYIDVDGNMIRFDTVIFYLYTKSRQELLDFTAIEQWRLALIVINTILALLTTITFMQTGLQDGLNVEFVKDKRKELIEISEKAARKRLYANYYFSRVYLSRLRSKREIYLLDNGLLYDRYFNDEGILKDDVKITKEEEKVIRGALKIKVDKISYDRLVNYDNNKEDEEKMRDIKDYQMTTGTRTIILKILMVAVFTFVSVSLIVTSQNKQQILLNLVSTILAFVAGFLQYLNSYTFVTDEYSATLDTKIRELKAFVEWEVPLDIREEIDASRIIEKEEVVDENTEEKEVDSNAST